jgi:hypothetical protein
MDQRCVGERKGAEEPSQRGERGLGLCPRWLFGDLDIWDGVAPQGARFVVAGGGADRADTGRCRESFPRRDIFRCLQASWGRGLEELGLELLAVGAVVDPAASRSDPLACGDRGSMAAVQAAQSKVCRPART